MIARAAAFAVRAALRRSYFSQRAIQSRTSR